MVALKTAEIDAFIARPNRERSIVLVFGPDAGLVHERVEALIRASVEDPKDPFSLIRLDGDEVSANPLRLVEEANTIPLFGGRRAVWVKAGARNLVPAVEALIAAPSPDCRVVIEAGDLRRNAALRLLCERSKNAATLPCYSDGERDLTRLIDEEMRQAGLTISPEARAALIPFLGGDRQASRNEIRKLALYAHGRGVVTLEDVLAVVADASTLVIDNIIDAAFAGKLPDVETHFTRACAAGTASGSIVSAALRQSVQLHKLRLVVEKGSTIAETIGAVRPPVHFRRLPIMETALKIWTTERLLHVMIKLGQAVLATRRQSTLAETIAHRALMTLAMSARRK